MPRVIYIEGFDQIPTVDGRAALETGRTIIIEQYRFGSKIVDEPLNYTDGSLIPSRTFSIERYNQTSGQWENIGYINVHLHKVKIDETDKTDVSVGITSRINPKN